MELTFYISVFSLSIYLSIYQLLTVRSAVDILSLDCPHTPTFQPPPPRCGGGEDSYQPCIGSLSKNEQPTRNLLIHQSSLRTERSVFQNQPYTNIETKWSVHDS